MRAAERRVRALGKQESDEPDRALDEFPERVALGVEAAH